MPTHNCSAVVNNNLNSFGCLILFRALAKSKDSLGKSFVEVFQSTAGEMEQSCKRMGQPQDRGNKAVVRLRGLPFQVSKEEIAQFFTGNESNPCWYYCQKWCSRDFGLCSRNPMAKEQTASLLNV